MISLIKKLLNNTINDNELTYNNLHEIMNNIEKITECKLYNKDTILNQINKKININIIKKFIIKNLLCEISFDYIFKNIFKLSIIFIDDDIIILHNKKKINVNDFRNFLLINHSDLLPPINNIYIDTFINILNKFINKDLSLQYYCKNIPTHYWKLFEIKCLKNDKNAYYKLNVDYKEFNDIINNNNDNDNNNELEIYKLEMISYLDDNDVNIFLNYNNLNDNNILKNIIINTNNNNIILKIYYINMFFINNINNMNTNYYNDLKEYISYCENNINIIQTYNLKFIENTVLNLCKIKDLILM